MEVKTQHDIRTSIRKCLIYIDVEWDFKNQSDFTVVGAKENRNRNPPAHTENVLSLVAVKSGGVKT